jgi:hypothetical protein
MYDRHALPTSAVADGIRLRAIVPMVALCAALTGACTSAPPPTAEGGTPTAAPAVTDRPPTAAPSPTAPETPAVTAAPSPGPRVAPAGTDVAAVEPHIQRLLHAYDLALTRIVADPDIAADPDHRHYRELRDLMAPDSDLTSRLIDSMVLHGRNGQLQQSLVEFTPVSIRTITGEATDASTNRITFPVCVSLNYYLHASERIETAHGASDRSRVTARRVDGRWRIARFARDGNATCPSTPTPRPDPTGGRGSDPPGTERAAVVRHIDRLLRTYDQTVAVIAADRTTAADPGHPRYDDLRRVLTPGIPLEGREQEPWAVTSLLLTGRAGIEVRPHDAALPVVHQRTGGLSIESRNEVHFDLCAHRHYELYDRWGSHLDTVTGPSVTRLGRAERVDGRWRLRPILPETGRRRCPPESP